MQKLIIKNIDGLEIIVGVGRGTVDPVETKKRVVAQTGTAPEFKAHERLKRKYVSLINGQTQKLKRKVLEIAAKSLKKDVKETPEYKNYERLNDRLSLQIIEFEKAKQAAIKKKKKIPERSKFVAPNDIKRVADAWQNVLIVRADLKNVLPQTEEHKKLEELSREANRETNKSWEKVLEARRKMAEDCKVYHPLKAGEETLSDQGAKNIRETLRNLPEKTLLLKTGEEIKDRRNDAYYEQDQDGVWKKKIIKGLKKEYSQSFLFEDDLTDADKQKIARDNETARLALMSPEEKQAELDKILKSLKRQAIQKKSELEFDGQTPQEATRAARAWFDEQAAEFKTKYGVEE